MLKRNVLACLIFFTMASVSWSESAAEIFRLSLKQTEKFCGADFFPNGNSLVMVLYDTESNTYELRSLECRVGGKSKKIGFLPDSTINCWSVSVSPDGTLVAAACRIQDPNLRTEYQSTLMILDALSGKVRTKCVISESKNPIVKKGMSMSVAWVSQGDLLVTVQGDPDVYRCRLEDGEKVAIHDYRKLSVKDDFGIERFRGWGAPHMLSSGNYLVPFYRFNSRENSVQDNRSPRSLPNKLPVKEILFSPELIVFDSSNNIDRRIKLKPIPAGNFSLTVGESVCYFEYEIRPDRKRMDVRHFISSSSGELINDWSEPLANVELEQIFSNSQCIAISDEGQLMARMLVKKDNTKIEQNDTKSVSVTKQIVILSFKE